MESNESFPDYIGKDLAGFYFNKKYPPNKLLYGDDYHGYTSPNQETFFYDYAVQGYGVVFEYKGIGFLIPEDNPCTLINTTNNIIIGEYESPIQLIENAQIDGMVLINIIDKLENVDLQ